jgi:hypothetical protein
MIQIAPRNRLQFLLAMNDFQVETADPPMVVRAKLDAIMGKEPTFDDVGQALRWTFLLQPPKIETPFISSFNQTVNTFTMRPSTFNRNSWRPQITGTIEPHGSGSIVNIRMRIHPLVLLFTGVMLFASLMFVIPILIALLLNIGAPPPLWLTVIFPIFIYTLAMGAFWWEANPAKPAIEKALR